MVFIGIPTVCNCLIFLLHISLKPVPGAMAGSRASMSNEMYTGLSPICSLTSAIRETRDWLKMLCIRTTLKPCHSVIYVFDYLQHVLFSFSTPKKLVNTKELR